MACRGCTEAGLLCQYVFSKQDWQSLVLCADMRLTGKACVISSKLQDDPASPTQDDILRLCASYQARTQPQPDLTNNCHQSYPSHQQSSVFFSHSFPRGCCLCQLWGAPVPKSCCLPRNPICSLTTSCSHGLKEESAGQQLFKMEH